MIRIWLLAAQMLCTIRTDSIAQCPRMGRFYDPVYQLDSIEVIYTDVRQNYNKMDVFFPINDSATRRPLLLLAHGGGFNSGDKHTDAAVNHLCRTFAQRGYVTASIQYRLTAAINLLDSVVMMKTVLFAIYDAKAAVRYFVKDAATTNQFKVDSNFIFIGGSSAGAVLSIHYAYLDQLHEVPDLLLDTVLAHGGLEGDAGNAGYSSAIKAAIPMAGGINKTWWIGYDEEPMLLIHGNEDRTVPYFFDQVYRLPPYNIFTLVTLYGSGSIDTALNNRGIYHQLKTYWGYDHTPWDTSHALRVDIDTIARDFFYNMICNEFPLQAENFHTIKPTPAISIYPNPADDKWHLHTNSLTVASITAYDNLGRMICEQSLNPALTRHTIDTSQWPDGLYLIHCLDAGRQWISTKKIMISH